MTPESPLPGEADLRLFSRMLDGLAAPEERDEFNERLRGNPELCEAWLNWATTHALLHYEHAGEDSLPELSRVVAFPPSLPPRPRRDRSRLWLGLAAAFVVGLLLNAGALLLKSGDAEPRHEDRQGLAVLSREIRPVWAVGSPKYGEGVTLEPGTLHLESGFVQLEFFSGATLILEGPAKLELVNAQRVVCRSGRLRASVPETAHGFTVVGPDFQAVDLGTEFALSVGSDGRSEVHVVEGEVRLDAPDGHEERVLQTGGGVRRTGVSPDSWESIPLQGQSFVDQEEMLRLADAGWQERYGAWQRQRDALRNSPGVVAFFDFEGQQPWDRRLHAGRPGTPEGAVIGARWTQGRWPGKGALEFKRITDRVRLHIPGEFDALTLAAWVRLEGMESWYSSLMLTDGWEPGEVHWQISNDGRLILGVNSGVNAISEPLLGPGDLGRWLHVAAVVDRTGHQVIQYLDGKAVSRQELKSGTPPLRFGDLEIGNWVSEGRNQAIRSLNGRIDELVVLGKILTPEEIQQIYTGGKPNG
ncbi:MAG: hypothetical protein IT576_10715 [Verrucomicrobiales bacterium]|nr:hypothetical protein [Verrucomicrobiales bacterium]